MKRTILLTILVIATLALLAAPAQRADDFEGTSACNECNAQADADWAQCVAEEAGGDEGDADCADKRRIAKNRCLLTFCIY